MSVLGCPRAYIMPSTPAVCAPVALSIKDTGAYPIACSCITIPAIPVEFLPFLTSEWAGLLDPPVGSSNASEVPSGCSCSYGL
jgi:hypothetical protein